MAFKLSPGRSPFNKTGHGIPSPLLGLTKQQRQQKKAMKNLVKEGATEFAIESGGVVATKYGGSGKLDRLSRRNIRQFFKGKDLDNEINTRKKVTREGSVLLHTDKPEHSHPHKKVQLNTKKEALDAAKIKPLDDSGRVYTKVEGSDFETRTPIDGGTQITKGYTETSPGRKVEKVASTSKYHKSLMPEFTKLKGNLPSGVTNITEYGKWKADKAGYGAKSRVKTDTSIERSVKDIKLERKDPVELKIDKPSLIPMPTRVTGGGDDSSVDKDPLEGKKLRVGELTKPPKEKKRKQPKPPRVKKEIPPRVKKEKIPKPPREKKIREKKIKPEKPSRGQRLVEKGLSKGGVCPPCDC
tara:strand:+ start:3070 stop:4134 length:1065 start_codon:yes stop_codon:yes gene_type:complete